MSIIEDEEKECNTVEGVISEREKNSATTYKLLHPRSQIWRPARILVIIVTIYFIF